jgi:hypothetical protein
LRSRLSGGFAVAVLLFLVRSVCAETDTLIHAAGFALTGSAKVDTKVIGDPAECVFGIKNDLFRLNNVYTDLIKIEAHQRQRLGVLEQWVTVRLQGAGVVFETTIEPPQDDVPAPRPFPSQSQQIRVSHSALISCSGPHQGCFG